MKFLKLAAIETLAALIDHADKQGYLKIENEPFMPLILERIGSGLATPWGPADTYGLCHYYEQNGDLMRDPEMCFFIIDNRLGKTIDIGNFRAAPFMFIQSNFGINEQSILFDEQEMPRYRIKLQSEHTDFANLWLGNIKAQGFLDLLPNIY